MSFAWTDDLLTGIQEIDAQHKALIGQFNVLIAACAQERGREEIGKFLTFLTGYVRQHFDDEERVMKSFSYTGLERHQQEHARYRQKLDALLGDHENGIAGDQVVRDAVWVAAEWFVDHIRQVDMAMAGALRSQQRQ